MICLSFYPAERCPGVLLRGLRPALLDGRVVSHTRLGSLALGRCGP